jgi:hypothetical protein
MGQHGRVDVDAYASEVFTIARALFALSPWFVERAMAYDLASAAEPERLGDLRGKYLKRGDFYIHIKENGDGQAMWELPDGVSAEDVIEDRLDVTAAKPLQDRLEAIERALPSAQDPRAQALADAIARILGACGAENPEKVFGEVKRRGHGSVLDRALAQPGTDVAEEARRFLEELGDLVTALRGQPVGDGGTIGPLLLMRDLGLALASRWERGSSQEAHALVEVVAYVAAPSPVPIRGVAEGLCARAIRGGDEQIVRAVAEDLKAKGDDLIERALAGDAASFYPPLYEAIGYEIAAFFAANAAAAAVEDPKSRSRWTKFATTAEESAVRIATSLNLAVHNLDGSRAARHVLMIRAIREQQGDHAARVAATDLSAIQWFYPRSDIPILLGDEAPPPERLTST